MRPDCINSGVGAFVLVQSEANENAFVNFVPVELITSLSEPLKRVIESYCRVKIAQDARSISDCDLHMRKLSNGRSGKSRIALVEKTSNCVVWHFFFFTSLPMDVVDHCTVQIV